MKMKKRYIALLAAALLIGVLYTFGYRVLYIATGSMSPALMPGDLIITRQTDVTSLAPGDIIVYDVGGRQICHRIISISHGSMITKGDANTKADPAIRASDNLQYVCFRIPFVGYPFAFLQNKTFLAALMVSVLMCCFLYKAIRKKE